MTCLCKTKKKMFIDLIIVYDSKHVWEKKKNNGQQLTFFVLLLNDVDYSWLVIIGKSGWIELVYFLVSSAAIWLYTTNFVLT